MLYYGFMLLFGQHCLHHHGAASYHHATTLGHALAPETLGHALELAKGGALRLKVERHGAAPTPVPKRLATYHHQPLASTRWSS